MPAFPLQSPPSHPALLSSHQFCQFHFLNNAAIFFFIFTLLTRPAPWVSAVPGAMAIPLLLGFWQLLLPNIPQPPPQFLTL